jgi:acetyl-CoA acetyltransferase family protein
VIPRLAIISGIRSPLAKAGTDLKAVQADDLGMHVVKELLIRSDVTPEQIDEVIIGNVAQPAHAANIARVIALKSGIPESVPAFTVHRNCASGVESLTTAALKIHGTNAEIMVVGGTESMSNIPLIYNRNMTGLFEKLARAKSIGAKLAALLSFRPGHLKPVIAVMQGLTDPVSGLIMGLTAENLARDFSISREEQDEFALMSHQRAVAAQSAGYFSDEIVPIATPPKYESMMIDDNGPRADQSMAALHKLRPYFDRHNGSVTVGNACPLTDGAAALIVMPEAKAKEMGLNPLGYMVDFAYAGCDPSRMGIGPVFSTVKLMKQTGLALSDFDLIELNEAFAAQVIACERAFASANYCSEHFGLDKAIGELDRDRLNVNGGAIALGHPVGTTGTRLVLTLLHELRRRNKNRGLATMCIGGGQGASILVEVD